MRGLSASSQRPLRAALDVSGAAIATLTLPPGLSGLNGIVANHAFATLDLSANITLVSDPVRLDIIP